MLNTEVLEQTKEVKGVCPYMYVPSRECYIRGWETQYTFSVIYYCLSSYDECEIYGRKTSGKRCVR